MTLFDRTGAFDDAVRREMVALLPRLRRFALGLTGAPHDADDLVQATCERAIRNLDKWTPGSRLDSWMYKIAQNLHRNGLRNIETRSRILVGIGHAQADSHDGEAIAEGRAMLDSVRRRVMELPREQREVLLLVCVEGLGYREVAELLEIPIGTVTSRLARARCSLKETFDDPVEDEIVQRRSA